MPNSHKINLLDALLVDQMAAGEVVERPASVAKELVENALDAGAQSVTVILEDGGLTSLTVRDDGIGMHPDDLGRCVLRHATSKIRALADLSQIGTLGFRGEALSSIAAVAKLTITTRTQEAEVATRLRVAGGAVLSTEAVGAPVGTTVAVHELFYNVPARRKFMRSPATEQAHVRDALVRVVLAARRGGLILEAGGRRLLDVPADAAAQARPALAFGRELPGSVTIDHESHGIAVTGTLAAQPLSRGDGRRLWLFVNGRFVRDRSLQRAAQTACAQHFGDQTPTALVYIDLPPDEVDVNVHPQKLEVRFRTGAHVHDAVATAMGQAAAAWAQASAAAALPPELAPARPAPDQRAFRGATGSAWRLPAPARTPAGQGAHAALHRYEAARAGGGGAASAPRPAHVFDAAQDGDAPKDDAEVAVLALPGILPAPEPPSPWQRLIPLGVAPVGYLCCQDGAALALVHMVAAERACLQAALAGGDGPLPGDSLMMPPTWVPPEGLAAAVDDYLIETAERPSPWGVQLEAVGPGHYVVMAVPQALAAHSPTAVAWTLVAALAAAKTGCHTAFAQRRMATCGLWLDGLLASWSAPASGSAAIWGPGWLARIQSAGVKAAAPILVQVQARTVQTLG